MIVIENGGKNLHEIYVPYVVGFPSHPMSRQEVEDKAMELMSPRLGSARARQVVERVRTLEQLKNGGSSSDGSVVRDDRVLNESCGRERP